MWRKLTGLLTLLVVLVGCGGVTPTASATSLDGTWRSSDPKMSAHISGNSIKVYWEVNGRPDLYWKGTLPSTLARTGKAVSVGDKRAMDSALLASLDSRKTFNYRDKQVYFTLSIAGVSTTVRLSR